MTGENAAEATVQSPAQGTTTQPATATAPDPETTRLKQENDRLLAQVRGFQAEFEKARPAVEAIKELGLDPAAAAQALKASRQAATATQPQQTQAASFGEAEAKRLVDAGIAEYQAATRAAAAHKAAIDEEDAAIEAMIPSDVKGWNRENEKARLERMAADRYKTYDDGPLKGKFRPLQKDELEALKSDYTKLRSDALGMEIARQGKAASHANSGTAAGRPGAGSTGADTKPMSPSERLESLRRGARESFEKSLTKGGTLAG